MWWIVLGAFCVVVLVSFLLSTKFGRGILRELLDVEAKEQSENIDIFPYVKVDLLSPAELSYYKVLCHALDGNYLIFPKVRLGDIINVEKGVGNSFSYWGKIRSRHVDFLICDKKLNYHCVVELDDSSHNSPKQKKNDKFLNKALDASGIRIVRQKALRIYDVSEIKKDLNIS
ncbi:MAG: DUF2726 domain-containing protein [Anaerohalosphaera sp.]|nr:DUF2726 domain-containing protein [Anaerohalosphaera sp.]